MAINEGIKKKIDEIAEILHKKGISFVFSVADKTQSTVYKRPGVYSFMAMNGKGMEILNMITNQIMEYCIEERVPAETAISIITQKLRKSYNCHI